MADRRRERISPASATELEALTAPVVLQAAEEQAAAAWRTDASPTFRDLLDAEPLTEPEA